MARWRLLNAHYLNVPGNDWQYVEMDRVSGKQVRRNFPVPQLLNPNDIADCNYKISQDEGEIIVCHEGKGEPKDIIFIGDPTPDMLPLDDEAKALSALLVGEHPIEALPSNYSQSILDKLQREVAEVQAAQPASFTKAMEAITGMLAQQTKILEQLASTRR